jgi:hypothetical protein
MYVYANDTDHQQNITIPSINSSIILPPCLFYIVAFSCAKVNSKATPPELSGVAISMRLLCKKKHHSQLGIFVL